MNLKIKKQILMVTFNIILLIVFFGLNMETVNTHEHAHKEIAQNHGCIDWRIETNLKGGGEFECLEYVDVNDDIKIQEEMLHSINEIVSYNISCLSSSIIIAVSLIINVMFLRWIYND